jgi:hypothetical protein
MSDELRLKYAKEHPEDWEKMKVSVRGALEKLTVATEILHMLRQNLSNVDGRGLSIAITHIETAGLWVKESTKVVEDSEG